MEMGLFEGLRQEGYGAILADPPWRFKLRSEKDLSKSPQGQYPCMSHEELCRMPVTDLAARDCVLIMWATWPMIQQAIDLMSAWEFTYKSGGAWAKQSKSGSKWAFGTGYIFRSASEPFIVGSRGKPLYQSRSVRNLIVAPVREHSRKPDDMHLMVERLVQGPYLEMFARQRRSLWDSWGNECDKFTGGVAL